MRLNIGIHLPAMDGMKPFRFRYRNYLDINHIARRLFPNRGFRKISGMTFSVAGNGRRLLQMPAPQTPCKPDVEPVSMQADRLP